MAASLLSMVIGNCFSFLGHFFSLCLSVSLFLLLQLCIVTVLLGVFGMWSARECRRALVYRYIYRRRWTSEIQAGLAKWDSQFATFWTNFNNHV